MPPNPPLFTLEARRSEANTRLCTMNRNKGGGGACRRARSYEKTSPRRHAAGWLPAPRGREGNHLAEIQEPWRLTHTDHHAHTSSSPSRCRYILRQEKQKTRKTQSMTNTLRSLPGGFTGRHIWPCLSAYLSRHTVPLVRTPRNKKSRRKRDHLARSFIHALASSFVRAGLGEASGRPHTSTAWALPCSCPSTSRGGDRPCREVVGASKATAWYRQRASCLARAAASRCESCTG